MRHVQDGSQSCCFLPIELNNAGLGFGSIAEADFGEAANVHPHLRHLLRSPAKSSSAPVANDDPGPREPRRGQAHGAIAFSPDGNTWPGQVPALPGLAAGYDSKDHPNFNMTSEALAMSRVA